MQARAMQFAGPVRRKSLQELRFEPLAGQAQKNIALHCRTLRGRPQWSAARAESSLGVTSDPTFCHASSEFANAAFSGDGLAYGEHAAETLQSVLSIVWYAECVHIYTIPTGLSSPQAGRAAFFPEAHLPSLPRVSNAFRVPSPGTYVTRLRLPNPRTRLGRRLWAGDTQKRRRQTGTEKAFIHA